MDHSLLQTSPSPILCKQSVPVGRAPEQARLPVAFPDSGGEFDTQKFGYPSFPFRNRRPCSVHVKYDLTRRSPFSV